VVTGRWWPAIAKPGFSGDNGSAVAAQLNGPQGLALDGAGNLYIADQNNHRIRKVTPAGIITTVAGTGTPGYFGDTGPATSAQLNFPQGIAVDTAGDLYIADKNNHRIRRVAPDGTITTVAGTGTAGTTGDGGPATSAQLLNPLAVALDSTGNLYVADKSSQVRKVDVSGNITHIAGTGTGGYSGDSGPASTAALSGPSGLAADFAGNLYIADTGNLRVRKISTGGIISTYAGNGTFGSSGDSGLAIDAQLAGPVGVSVEYPNTLYIADLYQVREVDTSYIIHTVAGPGGTAFAGDGGPATLAQFSGNWGIVRDALGPAGNLYVADTQNYRVRTDQRGGRHLDLCRHGNLLLFRRWRSGYRCGDSSLSPGGRFGGNIYLGESARVREVIASTGKIATVAGIGAAGWTGDGGLATSAKLALFIRGLAVDPNGNLYIADTSNNIVRKVTAGKISTVAGTGLPGYSGDGDSGTSAQLRSPAGLAVDTAGNLYIADFGNCVVRQLSIGGTISTVAGNGACGSTGDGEPATSAALNSPWGLAVDSAGNLYIATTGNTIREVSGGKIATIAGTGAAGYSGDGGTRYLRPIVRSRGNIPGWFRQRLCFRFWQQRGAYPAA
jgi:sugar lactone lactonase YvrE